MKRTIVIWLGVVSLLASLGNADILKTYGDGQKKIEGTLVNGQLEGVIKKYTHEGNLIEQSTYQNNELNGERKKFFTSGKIEREENFVNGKIDGEATVYYESGKVALKLQYAAGKIAKYVAYKEDGTVDLNIDYTK